MTIIKQTHQMQKGFSLIEVLVYLSVMVLVAGALITTFFSLHTVFARNNVERELTHAASVSLERMVRDMRGATTVNTGLSTLGSSPGVLVLDVGAATTTTFSLSGGRLIYSVNGTEVGPLTSDDVTVESLIFNRYVGTTTEMVRVGLTLSVDSAVASSTRTFYTSAVLRSSYD